MTATKRLVTFAIAVASIAAIGACGGGAPPPASPAQKSVPADQDGDGITDSTDAAPSTTSVRPETTSVRARAARADLDRAERELEASTGDCAAACRALGSMERATRHLCDLVGSSPEDAPRCDDAQRKVRAARDHVRSTCGVCPNGT
ncbi:MAG: hypothetical protein JWM74_393 [Myxococcaceae bacterium]|jgi:hypothetical protein|nr:hypothetical protein [Myxococcaceae bacterium]